MSNLSCLEVERGQTKFRTLDEDAFADSGNAHSRSTSKLRYIREIQELGLRGPKPISYLDVPKC